MKTKFWTVQYRTMDGQTKYAKVISDSVNKVISWVCEHEKISAEQILYMNGEEAEMV